MSIVLILVACTAGAEPACTEHAFEMPGWVECLDTLHHHGLRSTEGSEAPQFVLTTCAVGEPGSRRLQAE